MPTLKEETKNIVSDEEAMAKISFVSPEFENLSIEEIKSQENMSSDLSVFLKFKCDPFVYNEACEDLNDEEKVEEYRRNKFQAGKNYFTEVNRKCLETVDTSMFNDVYMNRYGPFTSIHVSNKARNASTYDDIIKLAYYDEVEIVEISTSDSYENQLYDAKLVSGIDTTNDIPIGGAGIKIGMLECGIPDVNHSNFIATDITVKDDLLIIEPVNQHANVVCSILAGVNGIARDASIYSAYALGSIDAEVEWMLDNEVHIINCSFGETNNTGVYSEMSAYMDYIVYTYGITVVAAVGNSGREDGYVANPAMGYNVIGVGAVDSEYCAPFYFSSFRTKNGFMKPNISATGSMNVYPFGRVEGTSFAAPMVSGIVAKLMEEKVLLRTMPELVMSILASGATNIDGRNYGEYPFDELGGYGVANFTHSNNAFYKEQYYNEETDRYYDPRRGYFDIEVERGARLRFAAAWLAHANGNKNATVMPRMFASVYSVDFEQELMYANYPNTNMQVMDGEIDVDGILRFHSERYSSSALGPRCVALSLRYII